MKKKTTIFIALVVLASLLSSCGSHGSHTNARNPYRYEALCN